MNKDILSVLEWRYATKQFDQTKQLSKEQEHVVKEALRLSPSSFGLQPWKFILVRDPELRKTLRQHAWDQPQITDASMLVVFCARTSINEEYITSHVENTAVTRGIPVEALEGYKQSMIGFYQGRSKEELSLWMQKQTYIALGMLLSACATEEIDTCPMEGFDAAKFDEVLKLQEQGFTATVICPVGFRSAEDKMAQMKKVRFSEEIIIQEI